MESPLVCLNVAGCYFTTARETVLREPASKLALQVRGVLPTLKDEAGHVFIDRDPRFFQAILNYLRNGWTILPPSAAERRELLQEVRFYQVCCPVSRLGLRLAICAAPLPLTWRSVLISTAMTALSAGIDYAGNVDTAESFCRMGDSAVFVCGFRPEGLHYNPSPWGRLFRSPVGLHVGE